MWNFSSECSDEWCSDLRLLWYFSLIYVLLCWEQPSLAGVQPQAGSRGRTQRMQAPSIRGSSRGIHCAAWAGRLGYAAVSQMCLCSIPAPAPASSRPSKGQIRQRAGNCTTHVLTLPLPHTWPLQGSQELAPWRHALQASPCLRCYRWWLNTGRESHTVRHWPLMLQI